MTLRTSTVTEGETLTEIITALGLETTFEAMTGTDISEYNTQTTEELPVTVLTETLSAADREYYFDAPDTGRDSRFRVITLTPVEHRTPFEDD